MCISAQGATKGGWRLKQGHKGVRLDWCPTAGAGRCHDYLADFPKTAFDDSRPTSVISIKFYGAKTLASTLHLYKG